MKHVMFDFDGTLADSSEVFIKAWNTYAEQYGFQPAVKEDLILTRNLTLHQRAKQFNFPMHKLPVILPKVYRYFKENIHEVKLFDGIREMLGTLAEKGCHVTILSSNATENIELLLEREQINTVSQVLTSSKLFGKDTVIKKFLKQQQLEPGELLYVGDEVRDIIACNKVNVPFIWVSWGLDGLDLIEKERPKYVVHTPKELLDKVFSEK